MREDYLSLQRPDSRESPTRLRPMTSPSGSVAPGTPKRPGSRGAREGGGCLGSVSVIFGACQQCLGLKLYCFRWFRPRGVHEREREISIKKIDAGAKRIGLLFCD